MVFTIHRYIFRDLLKYFLLATIVLSIVLALGVMLRPLQQFSVDPANVPSLVLCTLPITLTMVIPIAALLAATLVYGRLAHDNEISACRSSGISLTTLIYPALALALSVGIVTLLLAFHIIPYFTRNFERIIRSDAETIIFRNIQKKGQLGDIFPGIRIHADQAARQGDLLILSGVAVVWLDGKQVDRLITAQQVDVRFGDGRLADKISLQFYNATLIENDMGLSIGQKTLYLDSPSLWRDEIKFKTLAQLKGIRQDMSRFPLIDELITKIRHQILTERFFQWCDRQLGRQNHLILRKGTDRLRLEAGRCQFLPSAKKREQRLADKNRTARLLAVPDGQVTLQQTFLGPGRQTYKLYQTKEAYLSLNFLSHPPAAWLTLKQVAWKYGGQDHEYSLMRFELPGIALPPELVLEAQSYTWSDLRRAGRPSDIVDLDQPSPYLGFLFERFGKECQELSTDIELELHSRLAFGVACLTLVLLGAALGIVFRSSHLLTAFGVSFIPAALCLITIFTGKHIAQQNNAAPLGGICFLWSGIFAVALANALIYKALLRR
ncbi:MAG: LptF/LptG family permease [Sedimentisphaerales bacterium]|nr:LptF/LptG family permease [Sedimentisphaerales bacterium]